MSVFKFPVGRSPMAHRLPLRSVLERLCPLKKLLRHKVLAPRVSKAAYERKQVCVKKGRSCGITKDPQTVVSAVEFLLQCKDVLEELGGLLLGFLNLLRLQGDPIAIIPAAEKTGLCELKDGMTSDQGKWETH